MPRYRVLHRFLEWDGSTGSVEFGNTRRSFNERPRVGVPEMQTISYHPTQGVLRIRVGAEDERDMTRDECIEADNRMYRMDRNADDPWRKD